MFEIFLSELMRILAIDTTQSAPTEGAPFGKENADCLELTMQIAKTLGYKTRTNGGFYGVASLGENVGLEGTFGVLGHLDVVPFGKGWTKNALGEISDGVLYGRGVLDNKGPMLACLFAIAELVFEQGAPRRKIEVIFGCNEESGWKCIDKYNDCEKAPEASFSPDGDFPVINCEKGLVQYEISMQKPDCIADIEGGVRPNVVMDRIDVRLFELTQPVLAAAKKYGIKIDTDEGIKAVSFGKSAHGSRPDLGKNASWAMLKFLAAAYGGDFTILAQKLCDFDGSCLGIASSDDISGATTVNLGVIDCREQKMFFTLDVRYSLATTKNDVGDAIARAMGKFKVKEKHSHPSLFVPKESHLVTTLCQSYAQITGFDATPLAVGGATYARALPNSVAFGPILPTMECTIHQADERVSIDDLKAIYQIYKTAIKKLCF